MTFPTLLLRRRRVGEVLPALAVGAEVVAFARLQRLERFTRVVDPAVRLAAGRWRGKESLEVLDGRVALAPPHVKKRQSVMGPGQRGLEAQCLAITLDGLLQPVHAGQRDREVLERFRVVRLGAKCEPV